MGFLENYVALFYFLVYLVAIFYYKTNDILPLSQNIDGVKLCLQIKAFTPNILGSWTLYQFGQIIKNFIYYHYSCQIGSFLDEKYNLSTCCSVTTSIKNCIALQKNNIETMSSIHQILPFCKYPIIFEKFNKPGRKFFGNCSLMIVHLGLGESTFI